MIGSNDMHNQHNTRHQIREHHRRKSLPTVPYLPPAAAVIGLAIAAAAVMILRGRRFVFTVPFYEGAKTYRDGVNGV
jgi:hypothetical protein